MGKQSKGSGKAGAIVVRREEVIEGGHHGGAWKVAYADFVTAMMAFFLLMWLLNATTEEQRRGLADYFSPTASLSHSNSGAGRPFGGKTPFEDGALVSSNGVVQVVPGQKPPVQDIEEDDSDQPAEPRPFRTDEPRPPKPAEEAAGRATPAGQRAEVPDVAMTPAAVAEPAPTPKAEARGEQTARERQGLEQAAQQIRDAVRTDPTLADIAKQLAIDMTPEGLRIQVLDEERQPMFATGSATLNERARLLLQKVTGVLARLPQAVSVAGHTDAAPYAGTDKSNWELSAERANATRRALLEAGLPAARIRSVTGHADREPLLPSDPLAAANRRIAIVVLHGSAGQPKPDIAALSPPSSAAPIPAAAIPAAPVADRRRGS